MRRALPVSPDDPKRFWAVLSGAGDHEPPSLATLCRGCVALLPVSGAAVSLMAPAQSQSVASAFDGTARAIQDLEFTLGEGPAAGLLRRRHGPSSSTTSGTSMAGGRNSARPSPPWESAPCSHCPCRASGPGSGSWCCIATKRGPLSDGELADALEVADLITQLVLVMQSDAATESVAWALDVSDHRAVVHQATGMIAVQIEADVEEALVRLRAHAFAADRPIREVADDVVTGQLRFDDR